MEREYLATLNSVVSLDIWERIVQRAVEDAMRGDSRAREWLAKYLLGTGPTDLVQLTADELSGMSADKQIEAIATRQRLVALILGQVTTQRDEVFNRITQNEKTTAAPANYS